MHMRDTEVVASIVAGDPDGLAEAYDRYADPLYKYCRSLLSDPGDAADAVQDTFVVAAARLGGLRDPERLRAWLYAVARNECLRIARTRRPVSALGEAHDVTDDGADVGDTVERRELRALFNAAAQGLNPAEREAIGLQLRQGLEPAEVATVLGVSRNHAHALLSRARDQLEDCLGVLLVSRAGRRGCERLDAMLSGWDGRLTPVLRKRVHRHIQQCPTCTARMLYELRPAMLLGLSPAAALIAAAADSLRFAAGPPAQLKAHTIALADGRDPSAVAHQAAALSRAGGFGRDGFPKPVHAPAGGGLQHTGGKGVLSSPQRQTALAAGVLLAIIVAAIAFALAGNSGQGSLAGDQAPGAGASTGRASAAVATSRAASPTAKPRASRTPAAKAVSPSPTRTTPTPDPAPTAVATTVIPVPTTPPPTTQAPKPTPTTQRPTPSHTPTPTPTPTPTSGTLVVSPPGGQLFVQDGSGATFSVTAQGGPVSWSVSVSDGSGYVNVQPSSGQLAEGQQVTVFVTASHHASGRQLTVSPGGAVFTIVVGSNWPFGGGGGNGNWLPGVSPTVFHALLSRSGV
jgi:RNA polymerase sigma factor (sigma-70 family)